jgi:hypothetical protein
MLLLGAYNQVRFGSPFETGHRFQLGHAVSIGPEHVPANLYSYLLRPPRRLERFPFVVARWQGRPPFPAWLPVSEGYFYREPVAGLLYTSPFYLFAAAALLLGLRQWSVRAALVASTLPFAVPALYFASTQRYFGDVAPGLAVLSVLGLCQLLERRRGSRWMRRCLLGVAALAALYTTVMGLLLGTTSYFGFLPHANPELWHRLERLLPGFGP